MGAQREVDRILNERTLERVRQSDKKRKKEADEEEKRKKENVQQRLEQLRAHLEKGGKEELSVPLPRGRPGVGTKLLKAPRGRQGPTPRSSEQK